MLQKDLNAQEAHLKSEEDAQNRVNKKIAALLKKELDKKGLSVDEQKKIRLAYKTKQQRLQRKYLKWHAVEAKDVATLRDAIKDVKQGDLKGVLKAKEALQSSMDTMKKQAEAAQGTFLH